MHFFRDAFCALAVAMIMVAAVPMAGAQTLGEGWYRQWGLGQQARLARQLPALVYVYSARAIPCKVMEQEVFTDPAVAELMGKFTRIAVHHVDEPALVRSLELNRVPTILLQDSRGREIDRAVGVKDAATMAAILQRTLDIVAGTESAAAAESAVFDITQPRPNTASINLAVRAPNARTVHVVGDFNDWRQTENALRRANESTWVTTVHLPEGVYDYQFLIDGERWVADGTNPYRRPNPFGTYNSSVVVGNPIVSPRVEGRRATFLVYDPNAKSINIAGSFTGWQPSPMYPNKNDPGMWGISLTLPPGVYTYKYIIDGEWIVDPENLSPLDDGSGNVNSGFMLQ